MKSLHSTMQSQYKLKASMLISYCAFQYPCKIFKQSI